MTKRDGLLIKPIDDGRSFKKTNQPPHPFWQLDYTCEWAHNYSRLTCVVGAGFVRANGQISWTRARTRENVKPNHETYPASSTQANSSLTNVSFFRDVEIGKKIFFVIINFFFVLFCLSFEGTAIFFEFKHYKPKKDIVSTRCFAFMEQDEFKPGPACIEL